ncbi:golgin subfamily A member 3-like [Gossypium australe]|uniref:Golgin subfamily A member 3-like n=1 Tax=Gossypium australe TaxID=47621 RepID=A0A5B6WZM9_9ROSI|nr:golgin subfamily A member 3-like [Gossypium australe]
MTCETFKQAWDKLKEEFRGTEKTRQQQLLNLRKNFERLKINETKMIKQYTHKIMSIANNIKLFSDQFSDQRVIKKVITTLPEKYESKISTLEDSRDLTTISLSKLINALYTQEQKERAGKNGIVKIVNNLVIILKFLKTKCNNNNNSLIKLRLLMKIKFRRSSDSLHHALQSITKKRKTG